MGSGERLSMSQEPGDGRDLLRPQEIAQRAGDLTHWTILRWARRKDDPLPAFRPSRGTVLISWTAFLTWLERQNQGLDLEAIADEAVGSLKGARRET